MFLEKIYIFLWFWHVAIAAITFLSLLVWFHRVFLIRSRMHFILSYLRPLDPNPTKFRVDWEANDREFVDSYLGYDGLFIIRLISANCGGMLAGELVYSLWHDFHNPRSNGTEKMLTIVNRMHPFAGHSFVEQDTPLDWFAVRDSHPALDTHSQAYWSTTDSTHNHRSHFNRAHPSSFSRQKYATTYPIGADFPPGFVPSGGPKRISMGDDPTQGAHPTTENFQSSQLNDDIVWRSLHFCDYTADICLIIMILSYEYIP